VMNTRCYQKRAARQHSKGSVQPPFGACPLSHAHQCLESPNEGNHCCQALSGTIAKGVCEDGSIDYHQGQIKIQCAECTFWSTRQHKLLFSPENLEGHHDGISDYYVTLPGSSAT
jgi:hypothetical protein